MHGEVVTPLLRLEAPSGQTDRMGKLLTVSAWFVGTLVALLVLTALAVSLLFDPNDYKADIAQAVRDASGRAFSMDGDLSLDFFPWLAVEMGPGTLGNAEGFGEAPFLRFDSARLAIKLLPLVFAREIAVGTASLDGLRVNLAVNAAGLSNWDDLVARREQAGSVPAAGPGRAPAADAGFGLEVQRLSLRDAAFSYTDARAGRRYRVTEANLELRGIDGTAPAPLSGGFVFALESYALGGRVDLAAALTADAATGIVRLDDLELDVRIAGATEAPADLRLAAPAIALDTNAQTADLGVLALSILDLALTADVEPFAYAESIEATAVLGVAAFSPRRLLQALGGELPATADPGALGRLRLDARARLGSTAIALEDIVLLMDDTTLRGRVAVPRARGGVFEFDLGGDGIDLSRYLAPAGEAGAVTEDQTPAAAIPTALLRAGNARGKLTLGRATLGAMLFEDMELGVNLADGRLRLYPMTARLFDGRYRGDVRVDAAGDTPLLSVDERLENVSLAPLSRALFGRDALSGRINAAFRLSGRGNDMAAVPRTLTGNLSFELKDGTLEGRDLWYELRRARALIRRETPPAPRLPARTRFSQLSASGTVVDGVFTNDDLRAELPFLRLSGKGRLELVETTLDYSLKARFIEQPELMGDVTAAELDDFTKAVLPIRITGTLAAPDFGLDLAEAARARVKEEVTDRLLDFLGRGGDEEAAADPDAAPGDPAQDLEDVIKDRLRKLLRRD